MCSRADASDGLFLRPPVPSGKKLENITQFLEYKTAYRAPIRTGTELYGSATSAWVQASPQSEVMGPSSAGFALAPGLLLRSYGLTPIRSCCIDVLIEV